MPLILFFALLAALAYGVALGVTGQSIRWAERHRVLAEVNERSSHSVPTPRMGGVGLVAGLVVALLAYQALAPHTAGLGVVNQRFTTPQLLGLLVPTVVAFLLGLWDDRGDMPALAKLAGQALIAAIPPSCGILPPELHLPGGAVFALPHVLSWLLSFLWIVTMMNVVNFMDGINGIAGSFGLWVGGTLALAHVNYLTFSPVAAIGAALLGASWGFLHWNLPKARTFLGDCGSQPMGALVGIAILLSASIPIEYTDGTTGHRPFWPGIIAVSPFLFDVLFTAARRALQGENLLKAHRSHLYQRHLIATGEDHGRTLYFVEGLLMVNALVAILTWRGLATGVFQYVAVLISAGSLVYYYQRVVKAEVARA